ncbi:MAG: phosphopyruvate hydratase [Lachnospiraceae bacterium]|nr:phosphopyruvate hydratase [Lachnospiraceae bacterium]
MYKKVCIEEIKAREILDSRGNPTVEAEVILCDGTKGIASVPSGASTGQYEAMELRDQEASRYQGKGVRNAVRHAREVLAARLVKKNPRNQILIDRTMCQEDGTASKARLGANAILSISLANAKAAAKTCHLPLYQYLGGCNAKVLPVPMMNVINGGKHADSSLNIQEFMLVPVGAASFQEALEHSTVVFHTLGKLLKQEGFSTAVGDEGGYAPKLSSDEQALEFLVRAIRTAGYEPGRDFGIAMDAAATEMYEEAVKQGRKGEYLFWKSGEYRSREEMVAYWDGLCSKYPILSIEDGLAEEDWDGFAMLHQCLGDRVQLVGDDLFVTNTSRIAVGQEKLCANAVLIKVNQIGSLTETLDAIRMTMNFGWNAIVSHRSGETEDTTIADLAVATNAGQIKTGAPSRTDRTAKYNRLLRIEEELGEAAIYPGWDAFANLDSPWKPVRCANSGN